MTVRDRSSFGEFLRSRRSRLAPEQVGLSPGRRRRTTGLRREEVAELAGIGVDWYIRLEQGHTGSPSKATVDALARALKLNRAEHAHLKALAGQSARQPFRRETASETLRYIVEAMDRPAYVTGQRWDVLAWNAAAVALFGDIAQWPEADRNIVIFFLTTQKARRLFAETWEMEARRVVAQFRAAYDLWAGDPAFEEVICRVRSECPELERWWDEHAIAEPGSGRKLLHLQDGSRTFAYSTFQANDDPALKLAIYCPL